VRSTLLCAQALMLVNWLVMALWLLTSLLALTMKWSQLSPARM
jgi:hypothetical protein